MLRQKYLPAMEGVVLFAVLVLLMNPLADLEVELGRYSQISLVEEFVNIGSKEKSILDFMQAAFFIWANMRGFESGKNSLAAHRAPARVCVGDDYAE